MNQCRRIRLIRCTTDVARGGSAVGGGDGAKVVMVVATHLIILYQIDRASVVHVP